MASQSTKKCTQCRKIVSNKISITFKKDKYFCISVCCCCLFLSTVETGQLINWITITINLFLPVNGAILLNVILYKTRTI